MQVIQGIHTTGKTVAAWRTAVPAAAVTTLAAIIFLAVWSPISAEVKQGERNSPRIEFWGASLAGASEYDDRAKEANSLARNYGEWLSAAHRKAGVTAEEQPLPSQF